MVDIERAPAEVGREQRERVDRSIGRYRRAVAAVGRHGRHGAERAERGENVTEAHTAPVDDGGPAVRTAEFGDLFSGLERGEITEPQHLGTGRADDVQLPLRGSPGFGQSSIPANRWPLGSFETMRYCDDRGNCDRR